MKCEFNEAGTSGLSNDLVTVAVMITTFGGKRDTGNVDNITRILESKITCIMEQGDQGLPAPQRITWGLGIPGYMLLDVRASDLAASDNMINDEENPVEILGYSNRYLYLESPSGIFNRIINSDGSIEPRPGSKLRASYGCEVTLREGDILIDRDGNELLRIEEGVNPYASELLLIQEVKGPTP